MAGTADCLICPSGAVLYTLSEDLGKNILTITAGVSYTHIFVWLLVTLHYICSTSNREGFILFVVP